MKRAIDKSFYKWRKICARKSWNYFLSMKEQYPFKSPPARRLSRSFGGHETKKSIIVVGAHGAQFIKDLLVGTTAEKVVRKGDRPVLVVKRPVHGPYRRVLVAMDFSEQSRKALELGLRLAPGAKFHLLHAYQGVEEQLWRVDFPKSDILRYRRETARRSREQMKDFIRRMGFDAKSIVRCCGTGERPTSSPAPRDVCARPGVRWQRRANRIAIHFARQCG